MDGERLPQSGGAGDDVLIGGFDAGATCCVAIRMKLMSWYGGDGDDTLLGGDLATTS